MLSEIGQLDRNEGACVFREKRLTAVARGRDPRTQIHVLPHVSLRSQVRRAGMEAHPDADRAGGQRLLRLARGLNRLRRAREGVEEGIPLRIDLHAAAGREHLSQQAPVLCQRLGVRLRAELVQELGRPLDVGEEKGDGAGGELLPHRTNHESARVRAQVVRTLCGARWQA